MVCFIFNLNLSNNLMNLEKAMVMPCVLRQDQDMQWPYHAELLKHGAEGRTRTGTSITLKGF